MAVKWPDQPWIAPIKLTQKQIAKQRKYKTEEDLKLLSKGCYQTKKDFVAFSVYIPKGTLFDGASVPVAVHSISGMRNGHPAMLAASLLHDWLYRFHGILPNREFTRKEADLLFKRMCLEAGLSSWRADLAYRAVRFGGRRYWPAP